MLKRGVCLEELFGVDELPGREDVRAMLLSEEIVRSLNRIVFE